MGAGAIGSSVGADFTEAGEDVWLVDQWPAHVEAMRATGLRVVMPDHDLRVGVRALHLSDLATERPSFDIVFLATKSYDTAWMTQLIAPFMASDGVFVGLQNGMNEETIVPIIVADRRRQRGRCRPRLQRVSVSDRRVGHLFRVGDSTGRTDRFGEIARLLRIANLGQETLVPRTQLWPIIPMGHTRWSLKN